MYSKSMNGFFKIIKGGTDDPKTARKWHESCLPSLKEYCQIKLKKFKSLQKGLDEIADIDERLSIINTLEKLQNELYELWDSLLLFIKKWTVDSCYSLKDTEILEPFNTKGTRIVKMSARPLKPLLYIKGSDNPLKFQDPDEAIVYLIQPMFANRPHHCVVYNYGFI